jgi:hypothetical protein
VVISGWRAATSSKILRRNTKLGSAFDLSSSYPRAASVDQLASHQELIDFLMTQTPGRCEKHFRWRVMESGFASMNRSVPTELVDDD